MKFVNHVWMKAMLEHQNVSGFMLKWVSLWKRNIWQSKNFVYLANKVELAQIRVLSLHLG